MPNECNSYRGDERRVVVERRALQQVYPCPLHEIFTRGIEKDLKAGEDRMQRFEQKIDSLLTGQAQQNLEIQALKNALGNGVVRDIRETRMCVQSLDTKFTDVCTSYDEKFKELDDFRWFRSWANAIKNKTIAWILTFAFVGGAMVSSVVIAVYFILKILGYL